MITRNNPVLPTVMQVGIDIGEYTVRVAMRSVDSLSFEVASCTAGAFRGRLTTPLVVN
jgi:hypothetical protein